MMKRILDVILASVGLIVLAPFLGVVSLLIKLDSPGPVFYRGDRVGRYGKPFKMYKLRTMVKAADRIGPAVTRGRDPRVTRVGRVLRNWKLDELPQLINVVRGEMSLVGPRPESPVYVRFYTPEQRQVLCVRPGVTGPTQLRYRNEEAMLQDCHNLEEVYVRSVMPRKLKLDLEYARNRSLGGDLLLILRTIVSIFDRAEPTEATRLSLACEGQLTGQDERRRVGKRGMPDG